jgi:hypothetical protein
MKAFVSDFLVATKFYINNTLEARKAISAAKLVEMDPAVYLPMIALKRKEDGKPSRDYLLALQKALMRTGYINKEIDIDSILDTSAFSN